MKQENNSYIDQKIKEILMVNESFAELDKRKRIIRLILETIWLAGEVEGVQNAREAIK